MILHFEFSLGRQNRWLSFQIIQTATVNLKVSINLKKRKFEKNHLISQNRASQIR